VFAKIYCPIYGLRVSSEQTGVFFGFEKIASGERTSLSQRQIRLVFANSLALFQTVKQSLFILSLKMQPQKEPAAMTFCLFQQNINPGCNHPVL
jgi:hypothetical protein